MATGKILLAAGIALLVAGCEASPAAAPPPAMASPPAPAAAAQSAGWRAVLIAGDDQEPAFDNAVDAMAEKLTQFGVPRSNIAILKATASDGQAATADNIRTAFGRLNPAPTDGCFVFATSHGAPLRGLVLKRDRGFLTPNELGGWLNAACGNRPTVVIASGCFSGIFAEAPAMRGADRVILTAAREDRPSFGCNADRHFTVFDQCLLGGLERGLGWSEVMDRTRLCVTGNERELQVAPSLPQLSIGAAATGLRVFAR